VDSFLNVLRGHAAQLDQGWAHPRVAVVTSVDPQTFTARVTIQPEGVLSGWLPIASPWVGNGWGLACPPSPGDQVVVVWQDGDAEQGVVVGRLWSNAAQPPAAPAGELWLQHATGSFLKLHNDGSIESNAATWRHTGNLQVNGDVSDQHGTMAQLRGHYNEHVHPPDTAPPSPMD
jgi:phage baseplate assembly protein V